MRSQLSRAYGDGCPACGQPVMMDLMFEVAGEGIIDGARINLEGKVVGARVDHDCTPQVKRDVTLLPDVSHHYGRGVEQSWNVTGASGVEPGVPFS